MPVKKKQTTFKDWPTVYQKIKHLKGVSEKEKMMFAQGIAATPEERLEINDSYLRSLGLYSHWERKKLGFKL